MDKEHLLIDYFYELRGEDIAVNTNILIKKLYTIAPELKEKTYNPLKLLLFRILKKYNIILRRGTHFGLSLPEYSYDKVYQFIYEVIKKRKKLNIIDDSNNLNRIINIDETPVFLELVADKTFEKKGTKNIIIKTNGYEKYHVTIILAITAGGNKLPPVIIFKGLPDKNNEKRYNKLEVVKNRRILIIVKIMIGLMMLYLKNG